MFSVFQVVFWGQYSHGGGAKALCKVRTQEPCWADCGRADRGHTAAGLPDLPKDLQPGWPKERKALAWDLPRVRKFEIEGRPGEARRLRLAQRWRVAARLVAVPPQIDFLDLTGLVANRSSPGRACKAVSKRTNRSQFRPTSAGQSSDRLGERTRDGDRGVEQRASRSAR